MAEAVSGGPLDPALLLAVVFIVAGSSSTIGAVPFHMWVPTSMKGADDDHCFMSVAPQGGRFAVILRVFLNPLVESRTPGSSSRPSRWQRWPLGSFVALVQDNFKRLLAYSSIAHAGFAISVWWPAARTGSPA